VFQPALDGGFGEQFRVVISTPNLVVNRRRLAAKGDDPVQFEAAHLTADTIGMLIWWWFQHNRLPLFSEQGGAYLQLMAAQQFPRIADVELITRAELIDYRNPAGAGEPAQAVANPAEDFTHQRVDKIRVSLIHSGRDYIIMDS
jgi:hypothetical protein